MKDSFISGASLSFHRMEWIMIGRPSPLLISLEILEGSRQSFWFWYRFLLSNILPSVSTWNSSADSLNSQIQLTWISLMRTRFWSWLIWKRSSSSLLWFVATVQRKTRDWEHSEWGKNDFRLWWVLYVSWTSCEKSSHRASTSQRWSTYTNQKKKQMIKSIWFQSQEAKIVMITSH